MDLSRFVSDLLIQQGKLSVPGLGHFVHQRKSSYYDQPTGTIHPPYFETTFEHLDTAADEQALVNYIAEKKNISQASAVYFLDKYVSDIKERAEVNEVEFANLGTFHIDEDAKLAFRSSKTNYKSNAQLFGLPPVSIQKLADINTPAKAQPAPAPIVNASKPAPRANFSDEGRVMIPNAGQVVPPAKLPATEASATLPAEHIEPGSEQEVILLSAIDEIEERSNSNLKYWVIAAVLAIIGLGGLLAYYKLHRVQSDHVLVSAPQTESTAPSTTVKIDSAAARRDSIADTIPALGAAPVSVADTTNKNGVQAATATPPPANQPVTSPTQPAVGGSTAGEIPKNTWLIVGGQYYNFQKAKNTVTRYRALGYPQARLIDSLPKKEYYLYKVIFGYRYTQKDANTARAEILKSRKLKTKFVTVQPYK